MVKYIDVLFKRDLYKAAVQQEAISKQDLEKEENLFNLGGVSNAEYLEIKAQYARSSADVVSYQNQYQLVLIDLAQLLEIPDVIGFNIATPASVDSSLSYDLSPMDSVLAEKDSWFPEIKVAQNNMSAFGLLASGAIVNAGNCLFANCGQATVALTLGGSYEFNQCTMTAF